MYVIKKRKSIAITLILLILLCGISTAKQEIRLFSEMTSDGAITSEVSDVLLEQQPVRRERTNTRYGSLERAGRLACRGLASFRQILLLGFATVDSRGSNFYLSTFLHHYDLLCDTSGHLKLIHFIYEKDGKK